LISPGDVQQERVELADVVDRWNAQIGRALGVTVELVRWETHSNPDSGDRGQALLNKQIVDSCDFAIAVFWSRVGTPTGDFVSGSAEEIHRLLAAGKQLIVYFRASPIPQGAAKDFVALEALRQKIEATALVGTYEGPTDLREKVLFHLTSVVNNNLQKGRRDGLIGRSVPLTSSGFVDPYIYHSGVRFLMICVRFCALSSGISR
jgi:hypothetical protein